MATKKKTVQKASGVKVTIINQGKRAYQTTPENIISGGVLSEDKKMAFIPAGARVEVTKEYGALLAKNYASEVLFVK